MLDGFGTEAQEKLVNSSALVVGAGGLGCPVLQYLASAGVGKIGVVDDDKVELSNLNRQILFNSSDLGKYKVIQARAKIKKIYNKAKIKIFKKKISLDNI